MNILVLTSVYPSIDDGQETGVTHVVHYFTREWVKSGHNVIVIINANKYPILLYTLPKVIKEKINSKIGMVLPRYCQRKSVSFFMEGVNVFRIPLLKIIPKAKFSSWQIRGSCKKILRFLSSQSFSPDIICGHWENPQIVQLYELKNYFKCKTSLVFHTFAYVKNITQFSKYKNMLMSIDKLGFRSSELLKQFSNRFYKADNMFVCHSGIPPLTNSRFRRFSSFFAVFHFVKHE